MSLTLLIVSLLGAEPASRMFIANGATTEAKAKTLMAAMKVPPQLKLGVTPKVVASKSVKGLKPGFFVIVLGACRDVSASEAGYNDGLAALVQRAMKGSYARPVEVEATESECPLWLQPSGDAVKKAETKRDGPTLMAAATELKDEGDLVAATIVARKLMVVAPELPGAKELLQTIELIAEDLPDHLP